MRLFGFMELEPTGFKDGSVFMKSIYDFTEKEIKLLAEGRAPTKKMQNVFKKCLKTKPYKNTK
jgi:hypothetical protein